MAVSSLHAPEVAAPSFDSITPAQWQALAARRMYFGHQSVGGNIMDGVREVLAARPDIRLAVVETATLDSTGTPGLYHARIGRNGDPASKARQFAAIADTGAPAVGMLKYCYVDVDGRSDPDALFREYQAAMQQVRQRHPGLVLVHVTMPLTTLEGRKDWLMGKLRGRATKRDLNIIRNRYNALLRQAYAGKEPVFDLARLESTRPDGSRSFFRRGADTIYYLAPELTTDGGHLNDEGRRRAAREMLALLAAL